MRKSETLFCAFLIFAVAAFASFPFKSMPALEKTPGARQFGDVILHGQGSYTCIWFHGVATATQTIDTQNALTLVGVFDTIEDEDPKLNASANISTDLVTTANQGGVFNVSYHCSLSVAGGASKELVFSVGKTLATALDITDVTDNTITPIVITSTAHGLNDGDMVEIENVLVNTNANGSFTVANKTANTFEIVVIDGSATTGNGDYDEGTPTGDVTIIYHGNTVTHRIVSGSELGVIGNNARFRLVAGDKLGIYAANLDGTQNLDIEQITFNVARIGL